jgi:hypothetical protein
VIFAALWFGGIWLARKWESADAAAETTGTTPSDDDHAAAPMRGKA